MLKLLSIKNATFVKKKKYKLQTWRRCLLYIKLTINYLEYINRKNPTNSSVWPEYKQAIHRKKA